MVSFSKTLFVSGLIFIAFGGLAIFLSHQGFGVKLTIYSFWIFVLGLFLYILEIKNGKE